MFPVELVRDCRLISYPLFQNFLPYSNLDAAMYKCRRVD